MVRVLIVGTGGMANAHADAYTDMDGVQIVAGVDTNADNLAAFNAKYSIPHGFQSVEDAIVWGEFDAVSNVTPDGVHHRTTLPLLAAGKHVMKAADMVASGAIGKVRHFEASYLQSWLTQSAWGDWRTEDQWLWRMSTAHGSLGVLGDVGVHILDFATHVAGADVDSLSCRLTTFDKPEGDRVGGYTLDANESFNMHL